MPRRLKQAILLVGIATCGFLVGVVGLYLHKIRSGPCLEPWHTTDLPSEYSVDRTDVQTFDDYLALEENLFEELEERVYAQIGTGPTYGLIRYSAGSRSDPGRWQENWNRSYDLPMVNAVGGVLLLHGMTDSPYSLRALGQSLHEQGYWVVGLRLPGHGTVPKGMKTVRWQDMAAAVRLAYDHLIAGVGAQGVHIVGYSTGAPLALDLTMEALDAGAPAVPQSLVLISPAIGVARVAALAKWQGRLAVLPGLEKAAWTAVEPEYDPFKYNSFTANAGDLVFRLTRRVASAIETRSTESLIDDFPPTLAFLSTVDATVSADAVIDNLFEHLAPGSHELVLYDINRFRMAESVLVSDPGPLTRRLMADKDLSFALTLVTNEDGESDRLVRLHKRPRSAIVTAEPMNAVWPRGIISLSHVALPFPPDDPLYGVGPPPHEDRVFLGDMAIRGERGLLRFPANWLMRLRHNPFYEFQQERIFAWLRDASENL